MRAKILGIQFRKNHNSVAQEQECIVRETGVYSDIDFLSAFDESVDWNFPENIMKKYDGVILGGSGEFDFDGGREEADPARSISYELLDKLKPLFSYIFENDIPTLGICYGHQILGVFAGAQVYYDVKQKKIRSHDVRLMVDKNDYFLFSDLPDTFSAHYGHKDVLDTIPEGAVLLMNGGDECKITALKYKNNIYTTQFHPELRLTDMLAKIKSSPGYLPEGVVAEEIFTNDPSSNKILINFSKFVAAQVSESN